MMHLLEGYITEEQVIAVTRQALNRNTFMAVVIDDDNEKAILREVPQSTVANLDDELRPRVRELLRPDSLVWLVVRKRGEKRDVAVTAFRDAAKQFTPMGGSA